MNAKHLILMTACLMTAAVFAQEVPQAETRNDVEKWIETQRLVGKEKNDWRLGKELLNDRLALVRQETADLRERIVRTEKETEENTRRIEELVRQKERLVKGIREPGKDVRQLELRVIALLGRTPGPVRERLRPLSQRIPEKGSPTALSLSERYQNVIGILNELNKAAREITVVNEVRQFADGTQAEVEVFYIGLSQAYYCNEKAGAAGIGSLTDHGWDWEEDKTVLPAVKQLIAVYRNEKPPAFVGVPVKVQ